MFERVRDSLLIKNSLLSGASFAVPLLIMLLFTPTLVSQMGTEGYGLWNVAVSSLSMMTVFEFGLGVTISKFIAEYHESADFHGISTVISLGFIANVVLGLVLFFPLYFFADQISSLFQSEIIPQTAIVKTLQITSFGFVPLLIRNSGLAIPEGFQNFKASSSIRTIQSALVVVAAYFVSKLGGTIEQVAFSTVVLMWITGIASLVIAYTSLRALPILFPYYEKKYVVKMFSFVAYSGLKGIGAQLFSTVDRVAVGAVLGLSNLTYYAICIGVANKFIALASSLTQALVPATSSLNASGNLEKVRNYFWGATAVLTAINLIIGFVAILTADVLLTLWMGPEFTAQALAMFRVLIFIYMILAITAPAAQVANGIGIPWVNTIGALIGGISTIFLIIVLGRKFGLVGVGWANLASWVRLIAPLVIIWKLRKHTALTAEPSTVR